MSICIAAIAWQRSSQGGDGKEVGDPTLLDAAQQRAHVHRSDRSCSPVCDSSADRTPPVPLRAASADRTAKWPSKTQVQTPKANLGTFTTEDTEKNISRRRKATQAEMQDRACGPGKACCHGDSLWGRVQDRGSNPESEPGAHRKVKSTRTVTPAPSSCIQTGTALAEVFSLLHDLLKHNGRSSSIESQNEWDARFKRVRLAGWECRVRKSRRQS